jgi:hypothetical protein
MQLVGCTDHGLDAQRVAPWSFKKAPTILDVE